MPYRFLENIATADEAFEAWGETAEEMFISASDAVINIMVGDVETVRPRDYRHFRIEDARIDMLLFQLLQELIYYKDSEKLMLRTPQIRIQEKAKPYILEATALGEKLDPDRHHPRVDVKAVTLHRFRLDQTDRGWEAFVILDI